MRVRLGDPIGLALLGRLLGGYELSCGRLEVYPRSDLPSMATQSILSFLAA